MGIARRRLCPYMLRTISADGRAGSLGMSHARAHIKRHRINYLPHTGLTRSKYATLYCCCIHLLHNILCYLRAAYARHRFRAPGALRELLLSPSRLSSRAWRRHMAPLGRRRICVHACLTS